MISVRKKLTIVTVMYWSLLLYMMAALIWWFVSLQNQNTQMARLRLNELTKDDPAYLTKEDTIEIDYKRKTAQYIGEGVVFFAIIVTGAVFVYFPTRKQIILSHQQQNFTMAITHELKTPIAVTRLNLETLLKRNPDEEYRKKLITIALQETERLNNLCNNILLAAQLEGGAYKTHKEEINVSELFEGCVDDFKIRYPQRKINSDIKEGVYLQGEDLLLQMLINNLIENALKYSGKEAKIEIELEETNKQITLMVKDEGIGIGDDEKKKIFDKFYRIGDESTRKTKGTGIGLYLCRKIVKDHNGNIGITDNKPNGSIFKVIFNL